MNITIKIAGKEKTIKVKEFTVRERRELMREIFAQNGEMDIVSLALDDVAMPDCVIAHVSGIEPGQVEELSGNDFDRISNALVEANPGFFGRLHQKVMDFAQKQKPGK